MAYNEGLCEDRHKRIDERFEKGEHLMTAHEKLLANHDQRLAIAEEIARRRESLAWRVLTPAIEFGFAIASGLILAWFLRG